MMNIFLDGTQFPTENLHRHHGKVGDIARSCPNKTDNIYAFIAIINLPVSFDWGKKIILRVRCIDEKLIC